MHSIILNYQVIYNDVTSRNTYKRYLKRSSFTWKSSALSNLLPADRAIKHKVTYKLSGLIDVYTQFIDNF